MQQAICAPITGQRDRASGNFDTFTRRAILGAGAAVMAYGGSQIVGQAAPADPALAAWSNYKLAMFANEAAPDGDFATESEILEAAETRMLEAVPTTAAGMAAVLRYEFAYQNLDRWAGNIAYGRAGAADWEELRLGDPHEIMMWRLVETLEGMA